MVVPLTAEFQGLRLLFLNLLNLKARIVCAHFLKKSSLFSKIYLFFSAPQNKNRKNRRISKVFINTFFSYVFYFSQFSSLITIRKKPNLRFDFVLNQKKPSDSMALL